MWHKVSEVAKTRNYDVDEFVAFAENDPDRYGIVNEFGYPEVNTWYVDLLILEFTHKLKNDIS